MVSKFVLLCASALFIQAVTGHYLPLRPNLVYGIGGSSAAASSAASAAATKNAAAASAAAASAAAARRGAVGSASSSAAAASAARAASAAAASAAASSAGSARGAFAGLSDFDIVYSGPLIVKSLSQLYPNGISVSSENTLEGPLYVTGTLPFLSAVGFEDSLPTAGSGIATCGCGSGSVGMIDEI